MLRARMIAPRKMKGEKRLLRRRIRQRATWIFFAFLAISIPGFARQSPSQSQPIVVSGAVNTADGSPVPGATLRLTNTDTKQAWVSWTDESGKFEIPSLPAGHYTVEVEQLGFVKSSVDVQLSNPPPQPPPIQLLLHVATLAQLAAPTQSPAPGHPAKRQGPGAPSGGGQNAAANATPGPPGGPGGHGRNGGGRGQQLPPGVLNAVTQGMAGGGFQQTDVTGESGQGEESAAGTGGPQANAGPSGGAGSSSDSFLLQGTVGQGLSFNAGGGLGGFAGLGGPGGAGGLGGGAGGPGGGGGGMQGFGPGGGAGSGGPGGAAGGGLPGAAAAIFNLATGPGGRNGPLGRLFRQQANRIRFSFYDRYENSAFDARPYAITGTPAAKIGHYDEQVGGNMGGPLKIPHIYNGADHTYFFLNYQHETLQSPINTFSTVPTLAERGGLFCGGNTIFEPFTTTPFPSAPCPGGATGQQIPAGDFSGNAAVQGLLSFIPKPNVPNAVTQNYLLQATTPQNTDRVNGTILHTINTKFNLNGSYNFLSQRGDTLSNFADIGGNQSTRSQNLTLGLSHNWTSHVVESTSVNWSRSRVKLLSDNSFGADITAQLGIIGITPSPVDYGIPQVSFTDFSGFNDPIPSLTRNQTLRFDDNLSWTHKKHTMRFGGEARRVELNTQSNPNPRGGFVFTGIATGNDFADFLEGLPFNTTGQFGDPNTYFRSWGFNLYAQDDFRVSKKFTFQYGVRYDAVTPPVEIANDIVNLNITNLTDVAQVQAGAPGFPRALVHGDYHNFEPRIGIAWQPPIKPKTIVRAGYSIFYNESIYNTLVRELAYQPPVATAQTLTTSAPPDELKLQNPFQGGSSNLISIPNTESVDPNYKPGYAQIWSLGTETSISPNWILDLTYTGTKGTDLDILRAPNRAPLGTPSDEIQANRIDTSATGFTYDQSGANSIYNALQVRVVHRFTKGYLIQGIYTYGKSLDDASSIGGTGGSGTVEQQDGNLHGEYGLSTFDVRQQFRLVSTWELPFGQRSRWANHGWTEKVLGNWRLQNIFTWQTGTPFTVLLGGVASDNGTGANFSLRPDITGNPNLGICGGSTSAFFNTNVFALPTASGGNLTYGNEQRGSVEGPCTFNWNASLAKSFRFGPEQRHVMNVAWQVQNLANKPNYTGIGTVFPCFTGTSGISCGTAAGGTTPSFFGRVTSAGAMRTMDLMVRFNF
jgi:trimeric autotransporter adhesin